MIDLFHFLKDLLRNGIEVIAAFFMGLVVAVVFIGYALYWVLNKLYGKKMAMLEAEAKETASKLNDMEKEKEEHRKKAKERKAKIDELTQSGHSTLQVTHDHFAAREVTARRNHAVVVTLYKNVVANFNQLAKTAAYWKKQAASLDEQAKLFEKMNSQLWDLPIDQTKLTAFRVLGKNNAVIIAVTNLKGGVGKTTLTANIAATFCRQLEKRVLLVDLDFQASLTNLCLPPELANGLEMGNGRLIDNLFREPSPELAKLAFSNLVQMREHRMHLLAASENLANMEERSKARWLMNPGGADLRCALRSALHDPLFQENFDVILIDCPPRWTTSSINAIACCDYVLIPTQLDRVSSEAVPRLLAWLRNLRSSSFELYGNFEVLGVVGNLANPRAKLIEQERSIWEALPAKCKSAWLAPVYHFDTIVREKSEFRQAANNREFAALLPGIQPAFLKLIEEIDARRSAHEGS